MRRLISNNKGAEHLQLIVNNFFYIMMLIFATVILINSMRSMEVSYDFRLENMKFNNYVSRVMYSDNCFAYAGSYSGEMGSRMRVYPATIDVSKLSADRLNTCLWGLDEKTHFEVAIAELSDKALTAEEEPNGGDAVSNGEGTTGGVVMRVLAGIGLIGRATGEAEADVSVDANTGTEEETATEDTCESKGYTCINETIAMCEGERIYAYDDTCTADLVCCNTTARREFAELEVGTVHYSSRTFTEGAEKGAYDFGGVCRTTKEKKWDRVATFFVDIKDGGAGKRGIMKFCYKG